MGDVRFSFLLIPAEICPLLLLRHACRPDTAMVVSCSGGELRLLQNSLAPSEDEEGDADNDHHGRGREAPAGEWQQWG
jgi:hypothetical protein